MYFTVNCGERQNLIKVICLPRANAALPSELSFPRTREPNRPSHLASIHRAKTHPSAKRLRHIQSQKSAYWISAFTGMTTNHHPLHHNPARPSFPRTRESSRPTRLANILQAKTHPSAKRFRQVLAIKEHLLDTCSRSYRQPGESTIYPKERRRTNWPGVRSVSCGQSGHFSINQAVSPISAGVKHIH